MVQYRRLHRHLHQPLPGALLLDDLVLPRTAPERRHEGSRRYPTSSSSLARSRSRSITRDLVEVRAVNVPEALEGSRGPDREGVELLLVTDEQGHRGRGRRG